MAAQNSHFIGKHEGRPTKKKNTISRDFWHFSNSYVILKGQPRGIQKPKRNLPNIYGTRDMATGSFIFIVKHERGSNKNRNFLKFRFSDSLKAQNIPQRGPLSGHLIGPFLSEGFTSSLRPLPTCYILCVFSLFFC